VKEMLKEEFTFIYGGGKKKRELSFESKKHGNKNDKWLNPFNRFLEYFGVSLAFYRSYGPYEYNVTHRIGKYYFKVAGTIFSQIKSYLNASFKVPGAQVEVRI